MSKAQRMERAIKLVLSLDDLPLNTPSPYRYGPSADIVVLAPKTREQLTKALEEGEESCETTSA